jgi:hypothetical protein
MSETYKEYLESLKTEQSGMTAEQIKEQMDKEAEYTFDLNSFPSVDHNWISRGAVISCEGAGHPNHRHFLKKGSNQ